MGVFFAFMYKTNFTSEAVSTPVAPPNVESKVDSVSASNVSNEMSQEQVEEIVKNYLMKNPEIIVAAIEELQKKKIEESNKKANEYLKENITSVNELGQPPVIGSNDADITIVLFYDYNCSFCKQANIHINKILEQDKKVKVVLRPIPILGEHSMYIAKVALALHKIAPEKFLALHNEIMEMKPISDESIKKLISDNGIDYAVVENEINSTYIKTMIDKNFEIAKNLGIKGAPSQVINGNFIPGVIEADKYLSAFEEIRKAKDNPSEANLEVNKKIDNSKQDSANTAAPEAPAVK